MGRRELPFSCCSGVSLLVEGVGEPPPSSERGQKLNQLPSIGC